MNRFAVALLAAVIGASAAWSTAAAQENPGRHRGHHRQNNWQNGQCYSGQYGQRGNRDNDGDNDRDDNNNNNNSRYGQNGGQYGQYGQNGQYNRNGNCGQYGQSGNAVIRGTIVAVNGNQVTLQQQNAGYGGGYGGNGGYGQTITIDDQPALDNRTSGRVSVGRYLTAYGYWQNGVFYATQMN